MVWPTQKPPGGDAGWGPAKGPGRGGPKRSAAEARAIRAAMPPEVRKERHGTGKNSELRRSELLAVYEEIALDTSQPAMARVSAVDKYLDRTEGKPLQGNVNYDGGSKTLEQLIAESMKPKE